MYTDDRLPKLLNDVVTSETMDKLYNIYQKIIDSDRYGKDNGHLKKIESFIETEYLIAQLNYGICEQFKDDYNKLSLGSLMIFKKLLLRLLTHPNNDYIYNSMRDNNVRGNERGK